MVAVNIEALLTILERAGLDDQGLAGDICVVIEDAQAVLDGAFCAERHLTESLEILGDTTDSYQLS